MADLESIKPVVLQQPNGEKLQLELKITQVADDTTAIKSFEKGADISIASFDYATGIAVFFVLCATWFAYWCAKKSFDLTKQSFDLTIAQIKSAERLTFESNKDLVNSQIKQKQLDIKLALTNDWLNKTLNHFFELREYIQDYIKNSHSLYFYVVNEMKKDKNFNLWDEPKYSMEFESLDESYYKIEKLTYRLNVLLNIQDVNSLVEMKIEDLSKHLAWIRRFILEKRDDIDQFKLVNEKTENLMEELVKLIKEVYTGLKKAA